MKKIGSCYTIHQKSVALPNTRGKFVRFWQSYIIFIATFSNVNVTLFSHRIDAELCADRSAHRSNTKYWADKSGICYQDSVNPTTDLSTKLYESIEDCCDLGVSWLSQAQCFAASGVDVSSLASNSFYIQGNNCVQDCEGTAPCGGFAEEWDIKYDSEDECCDDLVWVAKRDCIFKRLMIWR